MLNVNMRKSFAFPTYVISLRKISYKRQPFQVTNWKMAKRATLNDLSYKSKNHWQYHQLIRGLGFVAEKELPISQC